MASGNLMWVLRPNGGSPPTTISAVPRVIQTASSPAAGVPVLRFDPNTAWHMDWFEEVPANYAGGGFTISWKGGTTADDTGDLRLDVKMVVIPTGTILTGNIGFASATPVSITMTPPATPINKINYSPTGALSHANAGSPAAADYVGIRVTRNLAVANTGFLFLNSIRIRET